MIWMIRMTGVTRGDGTEGGKEGKGERGEERERGEEEGKLAQMGRTGRHHRLYNNTKEHFFGGPWCYILFFYAANFLFISLTSPKCARIVYLFFLAI